MSQPYIKAHTTYHLAEEDDIEGIVALMHAFYDEMDVAWQRGELDLERFRAWLRRVIPSGMFPHIVAVVDGEIVGAIAYSLSQDFTARAIADIDKLYVRKDHRRSQIGQQLLAMAVGMAKVDGAAGMRAFVNSGIEGGDALFAQAGFAPVPHSVLMGRDL